VLVLVVYPAPATWRGGDEETESAESRDDVKNCGGRVMTDGGRARKRSSISSNGDGGGDNNGTGGAGIVVVSCIVSGRA